MQCENEVQIKSPNFQTAPIEFQERDKKSRHLISSSFNMYTVFSFSVALTWEFIRYPIMHCPPNKSKL